MYATLSSADIAHSLLELLSYHLMFLPYTSANKDWLNPLTWRHDKLNKNLKKIPRIWRKILKPEHKSPVVTSEFNLIADLVRVLSDSLILLTFTSQKQKFPLKKKENLQEFTLEDLEDQFNFIYKARPFRDH